jgi:hypothetical protein
VIHAQPPAPPAPPPQDFAAWLAQFPPIVVAGIIAAIVSLTIAIVTNVWQGKRERSRDRELWAREDRHRFADQKREIYSQYLAAVNDFRIFVASSVGLLEDREGRTLDNLASRLGPKIEEAYDAQRAAGLAHQKIVLTANIQVVKKAEAHFEGVLRMFGVVQRLYADVQKAHLEELENAKAALIAAREPRHGLESQQPDTRSSSAATEGLILNEKAIAELRTARAELLSQLETLIVLMRQDIGQQDPVAF